MKVTVYLHTGLKYYTGGAERVTVDGKTVRDCLNSLTDKYPRLKRILFDQTGRLLPLVTVSLNSKTVGEDDLNQPVNEDSELHLLPVIAGG